MRRMTKRASTTGNVDDHASASVEVDCVVLVEDVVGQSHRAIATVAIGIVDANHVVVHDDDHSTLEEAVVGNDAEDRVLASDSCDDDRENDCVGDPVAKNDDAQWNGCDQSHVVPSWPSSGLVGVLLPR